MTTSPSAATAPASHAAIASLEATFELGPDVPDGAASVVLTWGRVGPLFQPDNLSISAGEAVFFLKNVPFEFENPQHNFRIGQVMLETLASSEPLNPGRSGVLTIPDLPAGTYSYWCTIGAHWSAGMVGTLTVTP